MHKVTSSHSDWLKYRTVHSCGSYLAYCVEACESGEMPESELCERVAAASDWLLRCHDTKLSEL